MAYDRLKKAGGATAGWIIGAHVGGMATGMVSGATGGAIGGALGGYSLVSKHQNQRNNKTGTRTSRPQPVKTKGRVRKK